LDRFFQTEIHELDCPVCKSKTNFSKTQRFLNFPNTLVFSTQRQSYIDWVPKKVETKLLADETLDLLTYKAVEGP